MEIYFTGVIIAICTFLIIGLCHPLVIKTEYYTGTRYWWLWLVGGIFFICAALFTACTGLPEHVDNRRHP